MKNITELSTPRLILRQWQAQDRDVFARMNADAEVMKFYPALLTEQKSDALADRIEQLIVDQGWGLWALEEKASQQFIGFTGLHHPDASLPCAPCVEIGWRLDRQSWGKGYATEAAQAALTFAFKQLACPEVYSFASVANKKSQAVMQRLGMHNTAQNFEHPEIPQGHVLREHVLYCLSKQEWNRLYE